MKELPDSLQRLAARLPLDAAAWEDGPASRVRPKSAVLVALTPDSRPRVLLGRRALHLSMHPGEVAFPGGKREADDPTPWATARREAQEEVGLEPAVIQPLGELPPLVTRTGFEVYPCVAVIPAGLNFSVDPGEFASLFDLPLVNFADASVFSVEHMSDGHCPRMVPRFQLPEYNIWGVTAAILAMLANLAYDAGFDLKRDWSVDP